MFVLTLVTLTTGQAACGSDDGLGGSATAKSADAHAAQQSAAAADDGGSADTVLGRGTPMLLAGVPQGDLDLHALAANVSTTFLVGGCTGQVSTTTDLAAGTVTASIAFSGDCVGKRKVSGTEDIVLSFGAAAEGQPNLAVTEDLTWTLPSKDTVKASSLNEGPTATLTAESGVADSNVRLNLTLNEHRVRKSADGKVVFDIEITTAEGKPVVLTNSYGASLSQPRARTVASGTVNVHHNVAKFNASHDFQDVERSLDGTCACPESGTLVQTITKDDKSGGFVRTYAFTGCGQATVVTSGSTLNGTSNGSAQVTWDNCQL